MAAAESPQAAQAAAIGPEVVVSVAISARFVPCFGGK
jgi:hypothetical protein